jgi:hypothetical protein
MSRGQTLFVTLLTAIYLCFELAFNARLLDVVGGIASSPQLQDIERYGRSLSGIAVGLVVLQWLLARRARSGKGRPNLDVILVACVGAGALVFVLIEKGVDKLVDASDASFRRASLNIVLIQRSLVEGSATLAGLNDGPALFSTPAGKAFLAHFPLMAISVSKLDDKIADAKLAVISSKVADRLGGPDAYYDKYAEALKKTAAQWERYREAPQAQDIDAQIARQHERAWNQYLADLDKRGLTQYTVPPRARERVLAKVRAKVPVPMDWDFADEETFRQAVAAKIRNGSNGVAADGSATVRGKRISPGLDWPAFLAHPGVQAELRNRLGLPSGVRIQAGYRSGSEFDNEVFKPLVAQIARREIKKYEAPLASYADGERNADEGRDAARSVIVPPVALFFSFVGAVGHLFKLGFLLFKVSTGPARRKGLGALVLALFGVVFIGVWGSLSRVDNTVTRSRLYTYLDSQVREDMKETPARAALLLNTLHVVAIGQGLAYPVNEMVRQRVLGGMTFGYPDAASQPPHK